MPFNQHIIDNPKSERVRRVAELEKSKGRKKAGKFLIEGPQSVREAVRWMPDVVEDCYVQMDERRDGLLSPVVEDIAREADGQGLYIHQVTGDVMHRMSTDSQGIVAVGDLEAMKQRMSDEFETPQNREVSKNQADKTLAAFWQIRDPGNAGTVIRSADAAGCRAVIFVDDCVDRFNPKVIRSTAGSLFHLPVVTMGTDELFTWAQAQELEVMAADVYGTEKVKPESLIDVVTESGHSSTGNGGNRSGRGNDALRHDGNDNIARSKPDDENAANQSKRTSRVILFGNEARGLPHDVLERVQRIVSIPLYGKAESLNLATSTSVMLFTLAMARDAAKRQ
ncbi:RNA methyltransferase [Bifidobacterium sp. ESL0775]|uniref:TrmH family RNA methyltransferase n=1 Tax=Bifidobacterium sp. ESL0775 TaxID=2983230 RepID=UPI0023F7BCFB|nr:RNA methyltransferase [Bifidobacterium sp. ESL0775]WEV70016.1 RNA methyltransferase [Bifidobacterium sp. ESL0775]